MEQSAHASGLAGWAVWGVCFGSGFWVGVRCLVFGSLEFWVLGVVWWEVLEVWELGELVDFGWLELLGCRMCGDLWLLRGNICWYRQWSACHKLAASCRLYMPSRITPQ